MLIKFNLFFFFFLYKTKQKICVFLPYVFAEPARSLSCWLSVRRTPYDNNKSLCAKFPYIYDFSCGLLKIWAVRGVWSSNTSRATCGVTCLASHRSCLYSVKNLEEVLQCSPPPVSSTRMGTPKWSSKESSTLRLRETTCLQARKRQRWVFVLFLPYCV